MSLYDKPSCLAVYLWLELSYFPPHVNPDGTRFRTGKGYGFSAHFIGNTLVLETAGRSHKKPQTHPLPTSFQSYQVGNFNSIECNN